MSLKDFFTINKSKIALTLLLIACAFVALLFSGFTHTVEMGVPNAAPTSERLANNVLALLTWPLFVYEILGFGNALLFIIFSIINVLYLYLLSCLAITVYRKIHKR